MRRKCGRSWFETRWWALWALAWVLGAGFGPVEAATPVRVASVPELPRMVGAEAVALLGGLTSTGSLHAVVPAGVAGIHVLDLTDPVRPSRVGHLETTGRAQGVAAVGRRAFVADGVGGVAILDLSNPSSPLRVGTLGAAEEVVDAVDLAVDGDRLFVADRTGRLVIVDVRDPASPRRLRSYVTGEAVSSVWVSGVRAYVGRASGVETLDISNPVAPVRTGYLALSGGVVDLAVQGNWLYVAEGGGRLSVVDLSAAGGARVRGSLAVEGFPGGLFAPGGNYVYLAGGGAGVVAVEISDPDRPRRASAVFTGGDSSDVVVRSGLAYAVDRTGGLRVVALTNPERLGAQDILGRWNAGGRVRDVAASGSLVCSAEGGTGMQAYDFSNPLRPTDLGLRVTEQPAVAVTLEGRRAYVGMSGAGGSGMQIMDVPLDGSPANPPRLRGIFRDPDPLSRVGWVGVEGTMAYLAAGEGGLVVLDISNPDAPVEVGRLRLSGGVWGGWVSGGRVFVANGSQGMRVIDASAPQSLRVVGGAPAFGSGAFARGLTVRDGWAYVACEGYGVQVVDVRDPMEPRWVTAGGRTDTRGSAVQVVLRGDSGLVADAEGGVALLRVTSEGTVFLSGAFDTAGEAGGLAVVGEHVVVADDSRVLVMSLSGMLSGPNEAPGFVLAGSAVANEDAGPVAITNWVTGIRAGSAAEAWQRVRLSFRLSDPSQVRLFAEMPVLSDDGTLRFRSVTNEYGSVSCVVRIEDDGGVENGGVHAYEAPGVIEVRPVNDEPLMDSTSDLGWRRDRLGTVRVLTGIYVGPANERSLQAVQQILVRSGRPDVVPDPEVEYPYAGDPTQAALRFRSTGNQSERSIPLTITVIDSGGTERGGVDRIVRNQLMSVNPISGVQILDPPDGTVLPPSFFPDPPSGYGISVFASYQDGPVKRVELLVADGLGQRRIVATHEAPGVTELVLPWVFPGRGTYDLAAISTDPLNYAVTSAPVRVVVGTPPSLTLSTNHIVVREDTLSDVLRFEVRDGLRETPSSNLRVVLRSDDPVLLPESGLTHTPGDYRRTLSVLPGRDRSGTGTIRVQVYDDEGLSTEGVVRVTVEPVNDAPTVSLAEPAPGARFMRGDPITLKADVADVEGPVAKVEFLSGSTVLGVVTTPPFRFVWTASGIGEQALSARATDLETGGLSTVSAPVPVVIVNAAPRIVGGQQIEMLEDGVSEVALAIEDDSTPPASLVVSAACLDPGLVPALGLTPVYTANGWRMSVVPAQDRYGQSLIVIRATDLEGLTATNTIPLTVLPVDDPPSVSIALPRFDEVFEVGSPIRLLVDATDVDGQVAAVEVYSDRVAERLNAERGAPFDYRWTNATAGVHTLLAVARSQDGVQRTSSPVRITVDRPPNRAPVITATASVATDEDVPLTPFEVGVEDDTTPRDGLRFAMEAEDADLLPSSGWTQERTSRGWRIGAVPAGNRFGRTHLRLTATDGDGASTVHRVEVVVRPVNDLPRVGLLEPVAGARMIRGTTVRLSASVEDVEGPVSRVAFLVDGAEIGESLTEPHVVDWVAAPLGDRQVQVRAVDSEGGVTTGAPVVVTVEAPPNLPPIIAGGGPVETDEDVAAPPLRVTVTDDATPSEALRVTAVGGDRVLLPESGVTVVREAGGWRVDVVPGANRSGTTQVRVVATDTEGLSATNEFPVAVRPVNDAPVVRWLAPAPGAVVAPGTDVVMEVEAEDVEGPLARVEFLVDGRLQSVASAPPYRAVWSGAGVGTHELAARGVDGEGLSTTSTPVRITVTPPANRAPTVTGGGALTLYRDGASLPLPLVLSDDRTPLDRLGVTVRSSDVVLFPATGLRLSGAGASRSLTLVPAPGGFGNAVVEVLVEDGEGLSGAAVYTVTVLPVSELPGGEDCFADRVPEGFGTFNLLKTGAYRQEPAGLPAGLEGVISVELRAPPRYRVSSATVLGAGGFRADLSRREDGLFTWSQRGPELALLAGVPFGSWTTSFRLVLTNGEALNGFFPFAVVSNVPPVPRILNLEAGQAINPASAFALSWVPWTGSGTNDRVILTVVDDAGGVVVSVASDCSGQAVLPRQSAGIEISAGRLAPGRSYTGFLTFGATQLAVNDRSPLLMLRAFHSRTTQFPLRTLGGGGAGVAGTLGAPRAFGNLLVVTLRGTPGVAYGVEAAAELDSGWARIQNVIIPAGGTAELALPLGVGGAQRFYRAVTP